MSGHRLLISINLILDSDNKFWNLGLTRFKFSLTSEACVAILQNKLKKFDLSLEKDIQAICTDVVLMYCIKSGAIAI